MNRTTLQKLLSRKYIFSWNDVTFVDPGFRKKTLTDRVQQEKLIRLRRNRYIFPEHMHAPFVREYISHELMQPSYISMESALKFYQLIPETVAISTALTTKKTQSFTTPVGTYRYQHIKPSLLRGYTLMSHNEFSWYIAVVEKALLDFLYLRSDISTVEDIEELRIDEIQLVEIRDEAIFDTYTARFGSQAVLKRATLFKEYIHSIS